jgi:curli biogenesis system outer membrane secretion channel CsgG
MNRMVSGLAIALLATACAQAQQKKRVAVMNFDYATVQSSVQALWGTNQDIGKGIADMLVDRLVNDGMFSVIERNQLDKILAEQNFSNSDRADPASAAKIARVLGVQAIIIGSITQFGSEDKKTDVGGGALGNVTGRFGVGGVRKTNAKAIVQVTARMIDTTTAEILASCPGKGESSRSGTGLLGAGGSVYGPEAGGHINMTSSNFRETILGEATNLAVTEVAKGLEARAASLPTRHRTER